MLLTEKIHELYSKFFTEKFIPDVMFEGSLVLHKNTLKYIISFVNENMGVFSFFISKQLLDAILQGKKSDFQKIVKYYRISNVNIGMTRKILLQIENSLKIFEISEDDIEKLRSDKKYSYFYENLEKKLKDELLTKYIFEEWVFLQQYSTLVSAVKRVFTTFKSCGAVVVEYSKKAWQKIIENFDHHVKKEFLNNTNNNIVTNSLRLQYLGKWIGRNWPELLMINPHLIFPALGLRILMGFILIDP